MKCILCRCMLIVHSVISYSNIKVCRKTAVVIILIFRLWWCCDEDSYKNLIFLNLAFWSSLVGKMSRLLAFGLNVPLLYTLFGQTGGLANRLSQLAWSIDWRPPVALLRFSYEPGKFSQWLRHDVYMSLHSLRDLTILFVCIKMNTFIRQNDKRTYR